MDGIDGIPIAMLSGIGELNDDDQRCFNDICEGKHFAEIERLEGLGEVASNSMIDDAVKKQLIDTRNFISNNPASMNLQGGAAHWLKMLNYAIDNWDTPQREAAIDILAEQEDKWNALLDQQDLEAEQALDGLGRRRIVGKRKAKRKKRKKHRKQFFKNLKKAVKKVGGKIKGGFKKIGKALIRFNPIVGLGRGALILAIRVNLFGLARKLRDDKAAYGRFYKFFVKQLQGREKNLLRAIKNGGKGGDKRRLKRHKRRGKRGLKGLGYEPVTITTIITGAAAIMKGMSSAFGKGKRGTSGFDGLSGEDAEGQQAAIESGGEATGKALANFVKLLKKWFKRKKKKSEGGDGEETNEDTIDPEDIAAGFINETAKLEPGDEGFEDQQQEEFADTGEEDDGSGDADVGIGTKIMNAVKNNPVKSAIGGVVGVSVLTLAVSSKARKAIGLGGAPAPKKRKRKKPSIPNKVKTIELT